MKNNPQGFTLVELLITVSVIAILATIGMAVFNNAQEQTRDARRKADIQAIQKSLESHYNDASCGASLSTPYCAITTTTAAVLFASGSIPANPSSGGPVYIYPTAASSSYTTCALLEKATGNYNDDAGTTPNTTNTGTYYCLKNLQ